MWDNMCMTCWCVT